MIFTYTIIIIGIFLIINGSILFEDIKKRKVSNQYLTILILLLPFWCGLYLENIQDFLLTNVFLSILLLMIGIVSYKENTLLGNGDIKYGAILFLFLCNTSGFLFITNIGILTLITLVLWLFIILGQIGALMEKKNLSTYILGKTIHNSLNFRKMGISLWRFIFDWCIIGFLLSLLMKDILSGVSGLLPYKQDHYLIVAICIFFLRSKIRYLIENSPQGILIIGAGFMYMASKFYSGSLDYFLGTYGIFIKNIWIYALVIGGLGVVSQYIFKKYDFLLSKGGFKSPFQTIPYSVIIFTGFLMSFFGEISLAREILGR